MTLRSLPARLAALETQGMTVTGPVIIELVIVGAKDGKPDGRRTDWGAHVPEVIVNDTRHPVGADESAHQAVQRIAATLGRNVVAYVPWDDCAG
jgi:hypothetical protein